MELCFQKIPEIGMVYLVLYNGKDMVYEVPIEVTHTSFALVHYFVLILKVYVLFLTLSWPWYDESW